MDVSAIISRLTAEAGTFGQVIEATNGGSQSPIATQAALYSLLSSLVGGRMYPLVEKENTAHPAMTYQVVSSYSGQFDGYDITHSDLFVLTVRGEDYDALITLQGQIIAALDGENIEVSDLIHDIDQRDGLYRINMELRYSYITAAAQTLPAVYVYPISRAASESSFDNYTKQLVNQEYAFLVITADANTVALLDEIQAALLGWQQSAAHHEMQYSGGTAIESVGGLAIWREVYRDAVYIQQQ